MTTGNPLYYPETRSLTSPVIEDSSSRPARMRLGKAQHHLMRTSRTRSPSRLRIHKLKSQKERTPGKGTIELIKGLPVTKVETIGTIEITGTTGTIGTTRITGRTETTGIIEILVIRETTVTTVITVTIETIETIGTIATIEIIKIIGIITIEIRETTETEVEKGEIIEVVTEMSETIEEAKVNEGARTTTKLIVENVSKEIDRKGESTDRGFRRTMISSSKMSTIKNMLTG